jgi:spermidine/putrescine transport system permease protein
LFLRQDNAPLGSAVSIAMMLVIAVLVALLLWAIGYRKMRARRS